MRASRGKTPKEVADEWEKDSTEASANAGFIS
jgi:hypothetical protein